MRRSALERGLTGSRDRRPLSQDRTIQIPQSYRVSQVYILATGQQVLRTYLER